MPLTPAYTWFENDSSLRITIDGVPIKDQSQLFCSDRLVKLNAPPYLLLLDLKEPVDDDLSTATVLHGRKVVFQLAKAQPGLWGNLTAEGDKCTIKQQREASVRRAHEKQVATQQQRLARKQEEEKVAVDRQIAHERAQRERVEQLKVQELQQERRQLQDWQQQQAGGGDESDYEDDLAADEGNAREATAAGTQDCTLQEAMLDHPHYHGRGWKHKQAAANKAGGVNQQLQQEHQCTGRLDDSGRGDDGEASASLPEFVTLTAGGGSSSQATSALGALLSDAAAAATGHGCLGFAGSGGNAHTNGLGACSAGSSGSSSAAAAGSGDQLLTVRSSSSTAVATAAAPAQAAAPRARRPRPPSRLLLCAAGQRLWPSVSHSCPRPTSLQGSSGRLSSRTSGAMPRLTAWMCRTGSLPS
ncbi:hypothetical protein COO60DRAFT_517418 [Scenedesmus sp. NREL 46B-D3]|nr:hypothetical protein COO60DRAFT_517418 [Scenedesmus sp. NREL 46B-D3]